MKVICILLISIIPVSAVFSENLLKNPGMEESDSEALFWSLDEYTRNGSKVRIEKGNAHSGNNCVSIENTRQNDTRLTQSIKVKKNTHYKISGWIKTENVSFEGVGANLSFNNHLFISGEIEGTQKEWQYVEFYLSVLGGIPVMSLCLRLGGYGGISTGKAFFDDLSMEVVKDVPNGSRVFTAGSSKDIKDKNPGTNKDIPSQPEPVTGYSLPVNLKEIISHVVVYSLIGLSVIIFCIQLIIVKPKKKK